MDLIYQDGGHLNDTKSSEKFLYIHQFLSGSVKFLEPDLDLPLNIMNF